VRAAASTAPTAPRPPGCTARAARRTAPDPPSPGWRRAAYRRGMCRNITTLRGLEPAATDEEITAAALQFVRKVTGVTKVSDATREPVERATAEVADIVTRLLDELPARRRPPTNVPPLRRPEVQARIAQRMKEREEHERMHELGIAHSH